MQRSAIRPQSRRGRSKIHRGAALGTAFALLVVGFAAVACQSDSAAERTASYNREQRMQNSPNWKDGVFVNALPAESNVGFATTLKFFFGGADNREPETPPPFLNRTAGEFETPPASGLRVTWLGHSTMLLEIDGYRLLLDPIWSKRVSPFSFAGPARFHPTPLPKKEILKMNIDAVLISHDHYDHLDEETIRWIQATGIRFLVPLGVGAHLQRWGVNPAQIVELDWWEDVRIEINSGNSGDSGELRLVATPARHFSGRTLADRDETLWTSWSILGPRHRVFFSGDTALFPGFREIGDRFGPFDLTMMEVGAYNQAWPDVHMGPEQAVKAHEMVQGKVLLPVHWGTFDLGLHAWTEPIERSLAAAEQRGVTTLTPRPGESLEPAAPVELVRWWPDIPWKTAEADPVHSTGLEPEDVAGNEWIRTKKVN